MSAVRTRSVATLSGCRPRSIGNLIKYGTTRAGHQRYLCRIYGQTFTETKGTLFSVAGPPKKRSWRAAWRSCPKGSRISSVGRVKGHKADSILAWLRGAGGGGIVIRIGTMDREG